MGFQKGYIPWNKGVEISDEAKIKMSLARSGDKHWNFGKHHSDETKLKMSLAHKPSSHYFKKGHTINLGCKRSDETKLKMSLARIGITYSEETLLNMSLGQQGKKASDETKLKMSLSSPHLSGDKHPNWQGGITYTGKGYVRIYKPEHPFANKHGQVLEHRLAMEEFLGRYLLPKEVVHHINGIHDDNIIENLMLFINSKEHLSYHLQLKKVS